MRFFGCDMETLIKENWRSFVPNEDHSLVQSQFTKIYKHKVSALYSNHNIKADGSIQVVRWCLIPEIKDDEIKLFHAIGTSLK